MSISVNENLCISRHLGALACCSLDEDVKTANIAVVNLMPMVEKTEWDFAVVLGYYEDIHTDLTFFNMKSRTSKHASPEHFEKGYADWEEYDFSKLDAIMVTGAPLENVEHKDITYWPELTRLFDKADAAKVPMLLICWGAHAGLKHFHNLDTKDAEYKYFGVFKARKVKNHPLLEDMENPIMSCVSRHTNVDIRGNDKFDILIESECFCGKGSEVCENSGFVLAQDNTKPHIFYMQNHWEYDKYTLGYEYERDMEKGAKNVKFPRNYTSDDTMDGEILYTWHSDCEKFFYNFLKMVAK